jgi:ABC-type transport system involved in multi-copper enzyme maturation permease subunit
MLGVGDYFWRLIPANPILLRVVESGGKRTRDALIRCGYLGLLIGLVVVLLLSSGESLGSGDLTALAKTSSQIFQNMSYLQLGLVALLAPIFTAGAITQEKDSQTYDILLSTPLTNGQIVLGSLLSRLFFVIALLVSGIPIFSITQIFGGVAIKSIVLSFGLAAGTAFATGSLAMAIATFKVGTRRTIFSFYLFIVVYMGGLIVLDQFQTFHVPGRTLQQNVPSHISWFTGLNPFLSLRVIFNDPTYAPPLYQDLPAHLQRWPVGWYLSSPTSFYISFMFFISFLLVMPSILLLRRMAQSSTSLKTLLLQKLKLASPDKTRKPRAVWSNPIAWREAKTKASAARATMLRYGFILAGVLLAIFLVVRFSQVKSVARSISPTSYDRSAERLTIGTRTYVVNNGTQVIVERRDPNSPGAYQQTPYNGDGTVNFLSYLATSMEVVGEPAEGRDFRGRLQLQSLTVRAIPRALDLEDARKYLLGAVMIEFAVILLIVTNAAASTVTREKEDGTLDLLLSSPITSRYYIWGKLRGLVSFVLPLVAVPVVSVLIFVLYDIARRSGAWDDPSFQWVAFPEAVVLMPATLIIVSAFAAILGMQMSLRCRTTVMAVMSSVGIVVGVCAGLGFCGGYFLGSANNPFALAVGSFSPFTLMQMLIDPYANAGMNFASSVNQDDISFNRGVIFFCGLLAVGGYTLIVWQMYQSMVKNFDMTIRKQSR